MVSLLCGGFKSKSYEGKTQQGNLYSHHKAKRIRSTKPKWISHGGGCDSFPPTHQIKYGDRICVARSARILWFIVRSKWMLANSKNSRDIHRSMPKIEHETFTPHQVLHVSSNNDKYVEGRFLLRFECSKLRSSWIELLIRRILKDNIVGDMSRRLIQSDGMLKIQHMLLTVLYGQSTLSRVQILYWYAPVFEGAKSFHNNHQSTNDNDTAWPAFQHIFNDSELAAAAAAAAVQ